MKKSLPIAIAAMLWLAGNVSTQSPLPPTVQFSVNNYFTSENAGTATITVTLMGYAGGNTVTVDYATADGSATSGADYVATSGTLTFAPGETSKTFTVDVKTDLIAEGDETVLLSLKNPANAVLGIPSSATLTIWDIPPPKVQFDLTNYYVSENTGTVTITASLMGDTGGNTVTVNYATADGSATAPADYASTSGTLTFSPGTWSQSFTVTVNRDLVAESDETVLLSLSSPTNAVLGTNSSATLTIWDSPPPTVQFDMTSYSVSENTGTVTITASLMGDTGGNTVTVNYATADGSATAPADYASTSGTLTFSPGTWSQSFTVTVNRDLVAESDETVLLSLSSPTNAVLGTNSSATLTIWDSPPPTVQFDMTSYSVSENTGTVTITASLMGDTGGNTVTVNYATADGSATAPADYASTSGTLTFSPGTWSQSFTVTVNRDLIAESDETVLLSLSSPTNAVLGTNSSATLTIWDSPPPTVQFDMTSYSVSENTGTVTITASLMGDTGGNTVTVNYATADGSATAPADYASSSGTLTFSPGTWSQSFTVTVNRDLVAESDETVLLSLSSPTNAVLGTNSSATLTIWDSPPPTVQFDMTSYSVSENTGTVTITATLMGDTGGNTVTVDYATADGSAVAPDDYAPAIGTLTFAPGTFSQSFTVAVNRDLIAEPDETVMLTLTNPTHAILGTPSAATLTIWDSPPPTVQFAMTDYYVSESAGTATITATLMGDTGGNTVSVDYYTGDITAFAPDDYVAASGTLTFSPGTYSQSFTVTVNRDLIAEADETILLTLVNPTNAALGSPSVATLTIWDSPPPTVQFDMASYSVSENGGTATITVTLVGDTGGNTVTVDYTTSDGTATASDDYVPASGTLTFTPGTISQTFTVSVNSDMLVEGDETVMLALTNPTNAVLGTPSVASLTIWDCPPPTVQFDMTSYCISENAGTATITATLLGDAGGNTVTVDYATSDGTATSPGDYVPASGSLTFAPGTTSQTFTVTINRDLSAESDETVLLTLTNPANAILGTNSSATLTIWDCPPATVQFDLTNYSTTEDSGTATITVTLTGDPGGNTVTVDYATADGTATAGADYGSASGTLTFAPGETTKTFDITVYSDTLTESDETVLLSLSNVTNGVFGTNTSSTLTITDSPPPQVQFVVSDYYVSEDGGYASITVSLSSPSSNTVTVDYATADGTATAGSDYVANSGTLTFAPGETSQSFNITINQDDLVEGDETVLLSLSNPTNAVLGDPYSATLTIWDTPPPTVQFDVTHYCVTEDVGSVTITATLVGYAGSNTVKADYSTADGTAVAPDDYTSTSGTLSFAPGVTVQSFTVSLTKDSIDELAESFLVLLSNPVHATIPPPGSSAVVSIKQDKAPEVSVKVQRKTDGEADYKDVGADNRNVLPGQLMDLTTLVTPNGTVVQERKWVIDGKIFKDYLPNQNASNFSPIKDEDTTNEQMKFYWADTGEGRVVKGKVKTATAGWKEPTATFNVKKPDVRPKVAADTKMGTTRFGMPDWNSFGLFSPIQTGSGCTVDFTTKGGLIEKGSVKLNDKGAGYPAKKTFNLLVLDGGGYQGLVEVTTDKDGKVDSVDKDPKNQGVGYSDTVKAGTATGGSRVGIQISTEVKLPAGFNAGSGCTIDFTVTGGKINAASVKLKDAGTGYQKSATFNLVVTGGSGSSGIVSATTNDKGEVTGVAAVYPGDKYKDTKAATTSTYRWHWINLLNSKGEEEDFAGAKTRNNTYAQTVLDTSYPYTPEPTKDGGVGGIMPPQQAGCWADGVHDFVDTPRENTLPTRKVKKISVTDAFVTYVMFMPPGNNSRYVPVKSQAWGQSFVLENKAEKAADATIWRPSGVTTPLAAAKDETDHPQWTANYAPSSEIKVPTVTENKKKLAKNAPTIKIKGTNFDATPANNKVTCNLGASGGVTAGSPTELTVTFKDQPNALGPLTAVVAFPNPNINSGAAVQVATVVDPPKVTGSTKDMAKNAKTLKIAGSGFDDTTPGDNKVEFGLGAAGTVTKATTTELTVQMDTAPTANGVLTAVVTSYGGKSGPAIQVANVVAAPTVTKTTTDRAINAPTVIITGTNFSTTKENNTVVLDRGAEGAVSAATATELTVTFTKAPTSTGVMTAIVTSNGGESGAAIQIAKIVDAPTVTADNTPLAKNAPSFKIKGNNFSTTMTSNTVVLNWGAKGRVSAATATELTITFSPAPNTPPTSTGSFTAVVTSNGGSSAAVEVAVIVNPPTVTKTTGDLKNNAKTVTITGTNFSTDKEKNTVVLSSGTGKVTDATATQLTVTFDTQPTNGVLTAVVTSNGGSSGAAVQVAKVVDP